MDSVIKKFIDYLEYSLEHKEAFLAGMKRNSSDVLLSPDNYYRNKILERKNVLRILRTPKEEWSFHAEVFADFNILSEMLLTSPLKSREQLQVIFYMFEKNLSTGILGEGVGCFDQKQIDKYPFKYLTREEAERWIYEDTYGRIMRAEDEDLSELDRLKIEEFINFTEKFPIDVSRIIREHHILNEHYFMKRDSFLRDDVAEIIGVFRFFKVDEELCETIKYILEKEVKKREQTPKEELRRDDQVSSFREETQRLSEKEYNVLNRELKKYFDVGTMSVIRPLSLDEQIYCVSLMVRMNYAEATIKKILKAMNKGISSLEQLKDEHPFVVFSRLYNKLKYYEDDEELKSSIEKIIEYFKEIFILENPDDYEFWREMIEEELSKAVAMLPKDFDYEIEEGQKLAKLNK